MPSALWRRCRLWKISRHSKIALAQAKANGTFTASHQGYWDAIRRARGDTAGTRALIEILLAHRALAAPVLTAAMDRAVATEPVKIGHSLTRLRLCRLRYEAFVVDGGDCPQGLVKPRVR